MFQRLLSIISEEQLEKIENSHILLIGVGGVGGYTLESLIRSGFKNISIVDGDNIQLSNLNRQIISKMDNIGNRKALEARKRMLEINPQVNIQVIDQFLTEDNFKKYIDKHYDFIVDACDDIMIKIQLILFAKQKSIPIVVALGTGRKLDPTKLEISTIKKTYNDPLARKLRHELRKRNITLDIPCVFSKEEAIETKDMVGSAIFVPATAGILLAKVVFDEIIKKGFSLY